MDRRPPSRVGRRAGRLLPRAADATATCRPPSAPSWSGSSPGSPQRRPIQAAAGRPARRRRGPDADQARQPAGDGPVGPEGRRRPPGSTALATVLGGGDRDAGRARPSPRPAPCRSSRDKAGDARRRAARDRRRRRRRPADVRLDALAAVPGGLGRGRRRRCSRSCSTSSTREQPVADAVAAADVLARAKLDRRAARRPGRRAQDRRAARGRPPARRPSSSRPTRRSA